MNCQIIDLKPNPLLLNNNFEGYKLSLDHLQIAKKELGSVKINRVLIDHCHTYLHSKLYGLHNHLTGETINGDDFIYFVDKDWNLRKTYIDPYTNELINPFVVLVLPKIRETQPGDYNVSFRFVDKNFAVLSDGMGTLHILKTGCRKNDGDFQIEFSQPVLDGSNFVIIDAVYKIDKIPELHVLLLSIQESENDKHQTVLNWIVINYVENNWSQIALKQLESKGEIQYASLERNCTSIYVVSENGTKFSINSDHPVMETLNELPTEKLYNWFQNNEEIVVKVKNKNYDRSKIHIHSTDDNIVVKINNLTIINGNLHQKIDPDLTTWLLNNDYLEITLNKVEIGLIWPELIAGGDPKGQYCLDSCIITEAGEKLATFLGENENNPPTGITFNSQQVEECDFDFEKCLIFERIESSNNSSTHKIYLGTQQVLLSVQLDPQKSAAIGIRHDVDCCIWQPEECGQNFEVKHEGTLYAFGYVLASKQQKKFTSCSPDMETVVVCESARHLFIYKQNCPVNSGDLRNRSTGKRVNNTAIQFVVNIPNDEVLGLFISNKFVFLLGESYVMAIHL